MTETYNTKDLCNLNMPEGNEACVPTLGDYLASLLTELWREKENFSGKRPFGNSGWDYFVYICFHNAGIISLTLDEFGDIETLDSDQEQKADLIIESLIKYVFKGADNPVSFKVEYVDNLYRAEVLLEGWNE